MIALYALAGIYGFYLLFLAVCGIYVGWKRAPVWVRVLTSPIVLVTTVVDVAFNYTLFSLAFLQAPPAKCYTLTERISYYKDNEISSWRGILGGFICTNLLDPFQSGGHCK